MRYGVYEAGPSGARLVFTTIRQDAAELRAENEAEVHKAPFVVVQLGPGIPDLIQYGDPFFPKVLYRAERL